MDRSRLDDKHLCLPGPELVSLVTEVRERTLALVEDLDDGQLDVPYLEIVNPFLWELGHAACFWDAFVLRVLEDSPPVMDGSDEMYNSFDVDHERRWSLPLPSRSGTLDYMRRVFDRVVERASSDAAGAEQTYLYLLATRHEDMHAEAFTYMRQTLEYPGLPDGGNSADGGGGPLPGDVEIAGGALDLGAAPEQEFVFDNEKWAHQVEVAPFSMARAPVTNAAFAEFVDDGGYGAPELWSASGWAWRSQRGLEHPMYWERGDHGWQQRVFDRREPLAEHAPVVHVTWHEAQAWCRWAGRRLPTEAEWDFAARTDPAGGPLRTYPWGEAPPSAERAHLHGGPSRCVDVGACAAGESAWGCRQMTGNVWEWTSSPFNPFPGYLVDYPYAEYSAPWFGDRKVLKGGAWATTSRLANNTFRNFFPPDRHDVFAGFRTCARSS